MFDFRLISLDRITNIEGAFPQTLNICKFPHLIGHKLTKINKLMHFLKKNKENGKCPFQKTEFVV